MTDNPTNGEQFLLPVCLEPEDMLELWSALDLYSGMVHSNAVYPAFQAVLDAVEIIQNRGDSPCLPVAQSGACYRMDTTTEAIEFYPNNPFDDTDNLKTSEGMSWVRLGDFVEDNTPDWLQQAISALGGERIGYFPNDCFISYDLNISPINNIANYWNAIRNQTLQPFPTATIRFEGAGQMEVEFAQVPLGGAVIVVWDFEPEINDIVDIITGQPNSLDNIALIELQRDVLGIPPELVPTTIWQHDFEQDTEHEIKCYFVPSVQPDQPPFVFPFAGIRGIEFCGNIKVIGSETGKRFDYTNYGSNDAIREGVFMTDTTGNIRKGVKLGMLDVFQLALQGYGAGVIKTIEVAPDGTISVKSDSAGQAPIVDAETSQRLNGAAFVQASKFAKVFTVTNEKIGFDEPILLKVVKAALQIEDETQEATRAGAWVTEYKTSAPAQTVTIATLTESIFCAGNFYDGVANYALTLATAAETQRVLDLLSSVPPKTAEKWYTEGLSQPRTEYVTYACTFKPTQTYLLDNPASAKVYTFQYNYYRPPTNSRLIRMEATGRFVGSSGEVLDVRFLKDETGLIAEQGWQTFAIRLSPTSGASKGVAPPSSQLVFNEAGKYQWQYQTLAGEQYAHIHFVLPALAWLDSATGEIEIKLIDLGSV